MWMHFCLKLFFQTFFNVFKIFLKGDIITNFRGVKLTTSGSKCPHLRVLCTHVPMGIFFCPPYAHTTEGDKKGLFWRNESRVIIDIFSYHVYERKKYHWYEGQTKEITILLGLKLKNSTELMYPRDYIFRICRHWEQNSRGS